MAGPGMQAEGSAAGSLEQELELRARLRRLRTPLRLIFWGGLFVVLDFNLGAGVISETGARIGGRFDVLNDTLGLFLMTGGLVSIASRKVWSGGYETMISLVAGGAVAACLGAVVEWWFPWRSRVSPTATWLLGAVAIALIFLFCLAFAWLGESLRLPAVAAAWHRTAWLSLACYGGAAIFIRVMASGSEVELEVSGIPLLALILVQSAPLVSLFAVTRQMLKATETPLGGVRAGRGAM